MNLLPFQHNADTVSLDSVSNLHTTQLRLKKETSKHHREKQQEEAIALRQTLPASLQKSLELASEKGASASAMGSLYTNRHSEMHSVSAMDGSQPDYPAIACVGHSSQQPTPSAARREPFPQSDMIGLEI